MTRHSLYLFILINLLFSSQIDSINYQLAKYGINEWESIGDSEDLNELLTDILKDRMSPYLHPDNFLITIEMERTDITIYDSNYVEVTYPNIMKFNEKADINNQPCHFIVNMIPPNVENLVINYSYKPTISLLVNKSITNKRLVSNISELILEIMNQQYPSSDFLMCNDIINIKSVNINELKSQKENNQVFLNREDIYNNSWAVIIGIDNYENLSNLDYAVADAEAVKNMLINKFDYPENNVKLLLNEEANKANIVNVISDVSLKAGENDRILVFYAGHGETMPLPEGGEMGYLVPIDGNQDNLFASAIPMDDLKRLSNMSKAKHMLFLVDACYGGLAAVGSRGLEPAKTPNYIEKITNIKSRQIITAGGKDEKVFEKSEWGHSAYTKNLLSALEDGYADSNGDGYITADELGDYLSEKVSIDSENQQTPQSRRLTSHEGEYIFFIDNQFIIENKSNKNNEKSFKLIIMKYDSNFMNPQEFPPIVSNNISTMINSAPNFIIEEPNIMDENILPKEFEEWNNLMEILYQLENASIGDSITTYWANDYYFRVFVQ